MELNVLYSKVVGQATTRRIELIQKMIFKKKLFNSLGDVVMIPFSGETGRDLHGPEQNLQKHSRKDEGRGL